VDLVAETTQVPRQSRHVSLGAAEIGVLLTYQSNFHITASCSGMMVENLLLIAKKVENPREGKFNQTFFCVPP
jgi:hypothetical protein